MILLSLDPGTKKAGYALFKDGKYLVSGVIEVKNKKLTWLQRLDFVVIEIRKLLETHGVHLVVIEEPQLFLSSRKGHAASNSEAVLKLVALVHSVRIMAKIKGIKVVLIPVQKWKGNVPTRVTQMRIKRHLCVEITQLDESDAVGIGLYYLKNS